jgi:hypothetical protein
MGKGKRERHLVNGEARMGVGEEHAVDQRLHVLQLWGHLHLADPVVFGLVVVGCG